MNLRFVSLHRVDSTAKSGKLVRNRITMRPQRVTEGVSSNHERTIFDGH